MKRLILWLVSRIFPPRLPVIPEAVERVSGPSQESLGDGIVSGPTRKRWRDGIDRVQWEQQCEFAQKEILEFEEQMRAEGFVHLIHDEWVKP